MTLKHQSKRDKFEFAPVTEPRFIDEEMSELLMHILRLPSVYESAMPYLAKLKLYDLDDPEHIALVRILIDLYKAEDAHPKDRGFEGRVRHALSIFRAKPQNVDEFDEAVDDLLDECDGLLARAFAKPRREYDTTFGHQLLKRFLTQYVVLDPLRDLINSGDIPTHLGDVIRDCSERYERMQLLGAAPPQTLGVLWEEHDEQLRQLRGRELIGLKTGMAELDRRTLGLRGLTVFGAKPGAGKTTFALNVAQGICSHWQENECAVVVVSLDMHKFEIISRIRCQLAEMPWSTLIRGSSDASSRTPDSSFSAADQSKLDRADELMRSRQLDKYLTIVDRDDIGDDTSAERLRAILQEAKQKAGASRGLIIIDYLQLLSVPDDMNDGGDLGADKYRIRLVQRILEGSRTRENPLGDAAIVISESRKPPTSKESWGDSMSDLMGSARLGYAADAVVLYREMSKKELVAHYGLHESQAELQRKKLQQDGIAPVMLILEKGRDGMTRGSWPMEFLFRTSVFRELRFGGSTSGIAHDVRTRYSLDHRDSTKSGRKSNASKTRQGVRGKQAKDSK